ncbi:beta-ketoacyl-[acyl-carrier-protein] synthase family protein [Ktedonospora formicarum]|uniref:Putative polyketide beta-ketoacyl synthase 1 n=1 Tax=Ktedonospora formicarum TaxID=2778364 RepID=A0A8J3IBJ0_9CHLR|nr:beta-ketoacyl-[acyl-carrier-protein] synthase family protein [Ktedonospora formicarum]GHO50250.1 putative polyketide beta-ketoacyl synthase 1 [Ktedonospora formicarum]
MRKVVLTGLGVVSPLGIGKEQYWQGLSSGKSATKHLSEVTSCQLFENFQFSSQVISEADRFDPTQSGLPREVQKLDRFIQFAVAGALQAVEDAQLDVKAIDHDRAGIALSTAICGTRQMESEFIKVTNLGREEIDPAKVNPDLYLASMSNTPGILISALMELQGPCVTLSTGCIGGLDAIGYAFEAIQNGDADIMLTGASEAPITPVTIASFEVIHCLSQRHNNQPQHASRPFDAQRDGFVLAEGCGILVLEEMEHAKKRGAHIYAEIAGFSNTSNALHMTDLLSDGDDLSRAINNAIEQSGIKPTDIDYINAHASSTRQNDTCETSAIKLSLGDHAYNVPINGTKSMQGHALSAASALEVITCALSIERKYIHPTINYEERDPECDLDYVPNQGRPWDGDTILTNASGFAGLHASMVIRSASGEK